MPSDIALGLMGLLMILAYIAANFWFAAYLADWMDERFRPRNRPSRIDEDTGLEIAPDDEVSHIEWVETDTLGSKEMRVVTRGEMRGRYWMFLFAMPLLGYLNYRFINQVVAGFEFAFEVLGQLLLNLFYGGG